MICEVFAIKSTKKAKFYFYFDILYLCTTKDLESNDEFKLPKEILCEKHG